MKTCINFQPNASFVAVALAALGFTLTSAQSQTEILAIEFNEDDQEGFELWPSPFAADSSMAEFATDSAATSGTTTVTVTTSTGFGVPANRGGLVDEEPAGFTLSGMYQDLLHATSPTGFITLDFSGLNANQSYVFTLYAWDPGATDGSGKEWTVTGGTGDPMVYAVNFQDPLVDNDSFAMVFNITTTSEGTFQLTNTDGLPQSAINGFSLAQEDGGVLPLAIAQSGSNLTFEWEGSSESLYNLESSTDLVSWTVVQGDIAASPPTNTETIALPGVPTSFYRLERFPVPPATFFSETFDNVSAPDLPEGWTTAASDSDAGATRWELGNPTGGAANGPEAASSPVNCLGTNIASNYGDGAGIFLRTPVIDLTETSIASLRFRFFVDTPEGEEGGRVNLKSADGTLIQEAFGSFFWGQSEEWTEFSMRLPSEALGQEIILEFEFLSGGNADHGAGWYIDDVVVDES